MTVGDSVSCSLNPQRSTVKRPSTTQATHITIIALPSGAFVYRLGHGPLKAERRVRFPYALPFQSARPGRQELQPIQEIRSRVVGQCLHIGLPFAGEMLDAESDDG